MSRVVQTENAKNQQFFWRINQSCSRLLFVNVLTFTYGDPAVIYSLTELAHFWSKLLTDFLHVQYTLQPYALMAPHAACARQAAVYCTWRKSTSNLD
jgi:hypothetical protein